MSKNPKSRSSTTMQELHSENPLKREKHSKKKEKERKSHELESNCTGIATDDAAMEKHDKKKRRKMKDIEVSEVVNLERSDEPESKEEKKKRKREKRHKHENKEMESQEIEVISMEIGSGVMSQESKEEEQKRKREKSRKHENKERISQEIGVMSMEIGSGVTSQEAEASSEKYDKREIEAEKDRVVVSREGSDKSESKSEKKKRKREKSHKHEKLEYSGIPNHEGFVEPESKAEKKKRKREKNDKHDKPEKKSQDIEDNSTQEAEAALEKHDKKKRKKSKEIDVEKDIEVVSQEGFAEELTKDKKRKKKNTKEKSEEEIDISSKESKLLSAEDKLKNKKQEKGKEVVGGGSESSRGNASGKERSFDDAGTSKQKKPRKSVSFSGDVQVFPLGNDADAEADDNTERPLVQGKRFTKEEDELLKNAVQKYIEVNQLGNEGLRMVLNCSKYPQVRNCWKDIGLSIPWRPQEAVYYRAHFLFERSEARKWEPHEYETLLRLQKVHGSNWKLIGEELGKHRFQVKDTWRRIANQNRRFGRWSQEEFQALFDLVNLDLTMKAYDEKKTKHGMLRENISWGAIGKKLSTRNFQSCFVKWYHQLASPLVKEGHWVNTDDYRLLDALEKQDACCVEDVDWDNLLEHRSGEYCQKRWAQMIRYIGGYREKPFIEQVEVLCNRYCPEMLKYRKDEAPLASGSSLHKETENGEQVKDP